MAFAIEEKQPFGFGLIAYGIYVHIGTLQQEGILDDFAAMVANIQAITKNPENVEPPLK